MAILLGIFIAIVNIVNFIVDTTDSVLKQLHRLYQQESNDTPMKLQFQVLFPQDTEAKKRSEAIDRALEEDYRIRKQQYNVLPLGQFSMGEVVKQLKNDNEKGLTRDELVDYRYNIHQCVLAHIKALMEFMDTSDIRTDSYIIDYYRYLRDYVGKLDRDVILDENVGKAIEVLWQDHLIAEAFRSSAAEPSALKSAQHFFGEISRITASDYIPTEADILQSHKGIQGASGYRLATNDILINLIDVGLQKCERRKWIHQFDNVAAVLFVVDLPCYNQVFSDENAIDSLIRIFDTAVNSKLCARTTFILFLNNVSAFRQQLAYEPLGKYFPDYTGSNDVEKASEFLIRRFEQVNRSGRSLYSYLVDPYDTSNIQLVSNAIIDSI